MSSSENNPCSDASVQSSLIVKGPRVANSGLPAEIAADAPAGEGTGVWVVTSATSEKLPSPTINSSQIVKGPRVTIVYEWWRLD